MKMTIFTLMIPNLFITVARNKRTIMSSEHDEIHKPSNAVDGVKVCSSRSLVAASKYNTQPWLLIQLEATYNVKKVVIYARIASDGD